MDWVRRLVVNLNDIYGRILPGMILLANVYFLLPKLDVSSTISDAITQFFKDYTILFIVAFVLIAFVIGHVPLFLLFKMLERRSGRDSRSIIQRIDVTKDQRVIEFFNARFSPDTLTSKNGELNMFCKYALLQKWPESYAYLRSIELGRNLKVGMAFALLTTAIMLCLYYHWVLAIMSFISASVLAWDFFNDRGVDEKMALFLYYQALSRQEPD